MQRSGARTNDTYRRVDGLEAVADGAGPDDTVLHGIGQTRHGWVRIDHARGEKDRRGAVRFSIGMRNETTDGALKMADHTGFYQPTEMLRMAVQAFPKVLAGYPLGETDHILC